MKTISNKIKKLNFLPAVFRNNSFSDNFLLFLFIAAYVLIAADLCSEMAVEKNEIGTVIVIFEESESEIILSSDFLSDIDLPLLFEIPLQNIFPIESISQSSVNDRGPPEIV